MQPINKSPKATEWAIMGIVNATPDSFYDGGKLYDAGELNLKLALQQVEQMLADGAHIIDVGGESTRPGAHAVSEAQELQRVLPLIGAIAKQFPKCTISIDSRKPAVAQAALDAGATMLNDVSGFTQAAMLSLLQKYDCEAVMMHMQGEPHTMQDRPVYDDVVQSVLHFFQAQLQKLEAAGIARQRLILDPGIGFGKTLEHNLQLLRQLHRFTDLGCRLLLGASRKSFIGRIHDNMEVSRLEGSLVSLVVAYQQGARLFRVHDVAASVRALQVAQALA